MRLIYLSAVPWSSFAQRPHFMVRYFLRNNCREVIWIDPYPARLPKRSDLSRPWSLHNQGTPLEHGLKVIKPRYLPIDPLPFGFWINSNIIDKGFLDNIYNLIEKDDYVLGIGKPCSLAVELLMNNKFKSSFYDAMDDFPQFHSGMSKTLMQSNEKIISGKVDKIFCSSDVLMDKFAYKENLTLIENAFDDNILKAPLARKKNQIPVVGYIGSLGAWFDWEILMQLARMGSEYEFRLIGPKLLPVPADLPINVKIYPPCRHDEIPGYLEEFDVGLIPFIENHLTESVDPIKYYDYKSVGLPVITTMFGQMKNRIGENGVFVVNEGNLQSVLSQALEFNFNRSDLFAWRAENNWAVRFNPLDKLF